MEKTITDHTGKERKLVEGVTTVKHKLPIPPPRKMRCTKGHEWEEQADWHYLRSMDQHGKPLCAVCIAEFLARHCGVACQDDNPAAFAAAYEAHLRNRLPPDSIKLAPANPEPDPTPTKPTGPRDTYPYW